MRMAVHSGKFGLRMGKDLWGNQNQAPAGISFAYRVVQIALVSGFDASDSLLNRPNVNALSTFTRTCRLRYQKEASFARAS